MFDFPFRADALVIDPETGRYQENRKTIRANRVSSASYLQASIRRLEVMADAPLQGQQAIVTALQAYGHCLPDAQRECLSRYCHNLLRGN